MVIFCWNHILMIGFSFLAIQSQFFMGKFFMSSFEGWIFIFEGWSFECCMVFQWPQGTSAMFRSRLLLLPALLATLRCHAVSWQFLGQATVFPPWGWRLRWACKGPQEEVVSWAAWCWQWMWQCDVKRSCCCVFLGDDGSVWSFWMWKS